MGRPTPPIPDSLPTTTSRAGARRLRRAGAVAVSALTLWSVGAGIAATGALAQTTTTPTSSPSTATTAPSTATTLPTSATTGAGSTTTSTTVAVIPANPTTPGTTESTTSTPWLAIALIVVGVLILLVIGIVVLRRRRAGGAPSGARAEWRERAARSTAEAGACVRRIATGETVTGPLVQQLVVSIRTFGDLASEAPDPELADLASRVRRTLQDLGRGLEADHRLRAGGAAPAEVEASAAEVRDAAGQVDRALRSAYRELNEPE